ncbi:MAG TPA: MauE/DoxX family redox-associated membrane protein [Candidatus Saccharimonadales bacterium]|nr:MauE/DoxX family redox-associated membrane protein [Candidatus Saccharimonadales bacterium]
MSVFVQATQAPKPKTKNIRTVGVALAGVFVVMAVAQLFTFEDFPAVIAAMWLPGGEGLAPVRAAFIVALEVGAVPFLLGMRLSPAMRVCSMVAGWLAILAWFVVTIMQNLSTGVIVNNGMLGATVKLPVGWWNPLLIVAMGILAAWAAWGMWPFKKRRS